MKHNIMPRRAALLGALGLAGAGSAMAQPVGRWPDRPIRFIVAFPAGSGTDVTTRHFTEAMSSELGQPVVVDNRGGAHGFIASEAVARDGCPQSSARFHDAKCGNSRRTGFSRL